jgi:transposase
MRRHHMRKIRELLRLRFEQGCSHREIAAALGMSKGSVNSALHRAEALGLSWESALALGDVELERKLYPSTREQLPRARFPIDFSLIDRELRRRGVTLMLLWLEYCDVAETDPQRRLPYQYSQFCDHYREHRRRVDVTMRQTHRAGEKTFVDYSGTKLHYFDLELDERVEVELFVAVLGASNYTYAEASRSQKVADFCASTGRAFEYFGGTTQIVVPDQLRSAVKGPDRLDPEINPTYAEFGKHYGVAIIPARPRKPRDKAKVENAVLVVQRWIVACLRNRVFHSLDELNVAIAELLDKLNERPFRKLEGCRRSLYELLDKPVLSPLPLTRFEIAEWKKAGVNIDYHVEYDLRFYSVHHGLVGEHVEVRATATTIELFFEGRRVACHRRSYGLRGTSVTLDEHRPKSHQQYGNWPPSRLIGWAETIGPNAAAVVAAIMKARPHPEQGYRSCLALIRDSKKFGGPRTEQACARALKIGNPTRRTVVAILRNNLEQLPLDDAPEISAPIVIHDNVRGGDYFDLNEDNDKS